MNELSPAVDIALDAVTTRRCRLSAARAAAVAVNGPEAIRTKDRRRCKGGLRRRRDRHASEARSLQAGEFPGGRDTGASAGRWLRSLLVKRSAFPSHFSFIPVRSAMLPIRQGAVLLWPISMSPTGRCADFTQSRKLRTCGTCCMEAEAALGHAVAGVVVAEADQVVVGFARAGGDGVVVLRPSAA